MAIERQNLHRYAHFRIDFGLNEAQQEVQTEIPELVQYDNNSGMFVFDFFNLGRRVDTTGYTIVLNFLLPNNSLITRMVEPKNIQASRAVFYTPTSILTHAGMVEANITLFKEGINVTSPIRFKFLVQEGIESESISTSEDIPILQQLIGQVEEVKTSANEWQQTLEGEYNTQKSRFDTLYRDEVGAFSQALVDKQGEFDRAIGNNNKTFDSNLARQNREFNELKDQFDDAFNSFDMGGAFQEKFEGLEQQYAHDYADMKQTVKEIYTTTLTYRYVEDEQEVNEVDANSQE